MASCPPPHLTGLPQRAVQLSMRYSVLDAHPALACSSKHHNSFDLFNILRSFGKLSSFNRLSSFRKLHRSDSLSKSSSSSNSNSQAQQPLQQQQQQFVHASTAPPHRTAHRAPHRTTLPQHRTIAPQHCTVHNTRYTTATPQPQPQHCTRHTTAAATTTTTTPTVITIPTMQFSFLVCKDCQGEADYFSPTDQRFYCRGCRSE
ncbi:hypothetical protein GQ42DRAFT_154837 [Ramicandelaber brevisporus]|nr:hypothetical protein GQ42DRAFT_154837 [Ramicandelaber brevisporus]